MTDDIPLGPAWVAEFLRVLAATGVVKKASEAARISPAALYHQRRFNLRFADAWLAALAASPARPKAIRRRVAPAARKGGWRVAFIEALAESSNISAAAAHANVPLRTVYKVRRADAEFAAGWLAALHEGYDSLEMELLGYLRDPQPQRKMDVAAALRLLAAHRETVERRRAAAEEDDEHATLESIDRFLEDMRQRRIANTAILIDNEARGEADDGPQ
jgi:hypothetical protein